MRREEKRREAANATPGSNNKHKPIKALCVCMIIMKMKGEHECHMP